MGKTMRTIEDVRRETIAEMESIESCQYDGDAARRHDELRQRSALLAVLEKVFDGEQCYVCAWTDINEGPHDKQDCVVPAALKALGVGR